MRLASNLNLNLNLHNVAATRISSFSMENFPPVLISGYYQISYPVLRKTVSVVSVSGIKKQS